jgi:hypothetical protein
MGWEAEIETKHGRPLNVIVGLVYVLHYETPQVVKSVSGDYAGSAPVQDKNGWLSSAPIRHYVGWTQQANPRKRINRHGPAALREIVYLEPGTTQGRTDHETNGVLPEMRRASVGVLGRGAVTASVRRRPSRGWDR